MYHSLIVAVIATICGASYGIYTGKKAYIQDSSARFMSLKHSAAVFLIWAGVISIVFIKLCFPTQFLVLNVILFVTVTSWFFLTSSKITEAVLSGRKQRT